MAKITQVVALEAGHDGRLFRVAGETFSVDMEDPRFAKSTWFAPVDSKAAKVVNVKAKPDPKARPPGAGPLPGSAVVDGADEATTTTTEPMV